MFTDGDNLVRRIWLETLKRAVDIRELRARQLLLAVVLKEISK